MEYSQRHAQIKQEQALIDAELEQRWQRVWRAYDKSSQEGTKAERYAQEQCDLLRALEDNDDLRVFCQRVNDKQSRLPNGRLLQFSVKEAARPILHGQQRLLA
jgi:hypothetical protein